MSDDPFQADDAATPLTPDERLDLKLSYVALRRELNEAEALNVLAGERWALSPARRTMLVMGRSPMFKAGCEDP